MFLRKCSTCWIPALATGLAFLSLASTGQARVRVEAYVGQPLGIARVEIDVPPGVTSAPWDDDRFTIEERDGRVLYPVIDKAEVIEMVRGFLGIDIPRRVKFYFLFRGDEPLDLTIYAPYAHRVVVTPRFAERKFEEELEDWWDEYEEYNRYVFRRAQYPVVVQNFLTSMWARRLGQPLPEPGLFLLRRQGRGGTWLSQLAANEAYRTTIAQEIALGSRSFGEPADRPLPAPLAPPPLELPAAPDDVAVEPIAGYVPAECYYFRFGSFTNYLWFRDFLNHWRGDLANMLVLQSVERNYGGRIQQQLGVRETKLGRLLGPSVISDVAIIGLDPYLQDGTALGILFYARNSSLLNSNLREQRQESKERHKIAAEEDVDIAGHEVSYISTKNGAMRSYYAVAGDAHLVTNSRRLVERFYEAADGKGALAGLEEFRHARSLTPVDGNHTIFAYFSTAFFENLTSPAYRIELDRRLRYLAEIEALKLAHYAARAEGRTASSTKELIEWDILPRGFGARADGSEPIEIEEGFVDSVRGVPGWFVPVSDTQVTNVTASEERSYAQFKDTIEQEVGRFVPMVATVVRSPIDGSELDRIVVDVQMAPYSQTRGAQLANLLGPLPDHRVAPIDGDVVSGELVLNTPGGPIHFFGGVRDFIVPWIVREGSLLPGMDLEQFLRGYVGTWPRPHLLDRIFGPPTGPLDVQGIGRNDQRFGLWHSRAGDFFAFSFHRDVLQEVTPQLAMAPAENPAQVRLDVVDLSDRQLAAGVSALGYMRTRQASASGSRFINSLVTQLQVPVDQARDVGQDLVGGKFACPLGGEYQIVETEDGLVRWASSATPPVNRFVFTEIPADYRMPLLEWFRGMHLDVARDSDALTLHADVAMVRQEIKAEDSEEGSSVPSLNGLWNSITKPTGEQPPTEPHAPTEDLPPPDAQPEP